MKPIIEYVPKKLRCAVDEAWKDDDGYWISLKEGWENCEDQECDIIHEDTIADLKMRIKGIWTTEERKAWEESLRGKEA